MTASNIAVNVYWPNAYAVDRMIICLLPVAITVHCGSEPDGW